jgi:hypothetical protein
MVPKSGDTSAKIKDDLTIRQEIWVQVYTKAQNQNPLENNQTPSSNN